MIVKIISLITDAHSTIKDALKDGKLSNNEIRQILNLIDDILQMIADLIPNKHKRIKPLLKGIGKAINGIGYMVENPESGVDELMIGLASLLDGVRPQVPRHVGYLIKGVADSMRGVALFIRNMPKKK